MAGSISKWGRDGLLKISTRVLRLSDVGSEERKGENNEKYN